MHRKTVSGIVLTLLTLSMLTSAFNIKPVGAVGTIYIRADGSVDPFTAPIQRDGDIYTLTGSITCDEDGIVIERDNMTLDGAGYTVQGTEVGSGLSIGIDLTYRSNVTIQNMEIRGFYWGTNLRESSNSSISRSNITKNHSSGIRLDFSSNNRVTANNIADNGGDGIDFVWSSNNTASANNMTDGISFYHSKKNSAIENNITDNYYGISLYEWSSNNSVVGNNIINNNEGIGIKYSSNYNSIIENTFVNNGLFVFESYRNFVDRNLVNGKPLIYIEEVSDYVVENAGQVVLVNCNGIDVENLDLSNATIGVELFGTNNTRVSKNNITNNWDAGIWLHKSWSNSLVENNITNSTIGIQLDERSDYNSIVGNKITNCVDYGIWLHESWSNSLVENNITNNNCGIHLEHSSCFNAFVANNIAANSWLGVRVSESLNNKFYRNSFIDNLGPHVDDPAWDDATITPSTNVWDDGYPSGGNYWSDYSGLDLYSGSYQNETGSDGIGDVPYDVCGLNHDFYVETRDNYPFIDRARDTLYITPNIGSVLRLVTVSIAGFGFSEGMIVKLAREGCADILSFNTRVLGSNLIVTNFDLREKEDGLWDLAITLQNGTELRLPEAFRIVLGEVPPRLWIDVIGRNQIRVGLETTYTIRIQNLDDFRAEQLCLNISMESPIKKMRVQREDGTILIDRVTDPSLIDPTIIWIPQIESHEIVELTVTLYAGREGEDPLIVPVLLWLGYTYGKIFIKDLIKNSIIASFGQISELDEPIKAKAFSDAVWKGLQMTIEDFKSLPFHVKELSKSILAELTGSWVSYMFEGLTALDIADGAQVEYEKALQRRVAETSAESLPSPVTQCYKSITPVVSIDPNDKVGPSGFGSKNFIPKIEEIPYTIYFENLENATAEAEDVVITDQLDLDLDWNTLSIGEVSHPDKMSWQFDNNTGTITWSFNGINLPPNKNPPEGEGWVRFAMKPKLSLASGTEIRNKATIVFDVNPSVDTPEWTNIIDSQPPSSAVQGLPSTQSSSFEVNWSGTDEDGSSIQYYTIYVSDNGGPYSSWLSYITNTSGTFSGEAGHTYAFYSVAEDEVGNLEEKPVEPDTVTTIVSVVGQPNIAVTNITASESVIEKGSTLSINVTVANEGYYPETFNLTLYANTTAIKTQNITLIGRSSDTITFVWNTTGFASGNYTVNAYAWPVPSEVETNDNLYVDGTVQIKVTDDAPPATVLNIGQPKFAVDDAVYTTSHTQITLAAEDNPGGSGVTSTSCRVYNATHDSGWTTYTGSFYLIGLGDSTYYIDYNSTDNAGNVEPTNTATVILDNTPPATSITIGDPKYVSSRIYVTPDTPFTLAATDAGSGVKLTAYRITNSSGYNSGWQTYSNPFNLTSLSDGNYTVAFNSTDNLGHIETTHQISVTLFSWNYVFKDSGGRGTMLKINLAYKFFEFIAPGKDYGIRKASYMQVCGRVIIINHSDGQLKLLTTAVDTKLDICIATAWDKQTGKMYLLVHTPKPNCIPR